MEDNHSTATPKNSAIRNDSVNEHSNDDDEEEDVAFASMDFTGVNFDETATGISDHGNSPQTEDNESLALSYESYFLLRNSGSVDTDELQRELDYRGTYTEKDKQMKRIRELSRQLCEGQYADALRGETAMELFGLNSSRDNQSSSDTVSRKVRDVVLSYCTSVGSCVEVELLAVASFNLFLQLNYTGPTLDWGIKPEKKTDDDDDLLRNINPHPSFRSYLKSFPSQIESDRLQEVSVSENGRTSTALKEEKAKEEEEKERPLSTSFAATASKRDVKYHNSVLAELAVDGDWPCQVCDVPYFLLLSRSILLTLADPHRLDWTHSVADTQDKNTAVCSEVLFLEEKIHRNFFERRGPGDALTAFTAASSQLRAAQLWSARAAVAHQRLLQGKEPSATLWEEVRSMFEQSISSFCKGIDDQEPASRGNDEAKPKQKQYCSQTMAATVMLEWGLAQHHFDRKGKGKLAFNEAMKISGLTVEITGAEGKRTKFQKKATAQMLVRATSAGAPKSSACGTNGKKKKIESEIAEISSRKSPDDDKLPDTFMISMPTQKKDNIKAQMIQHDEEEILLERIKFEDDKENKPEMLNILDQAILLALCLDVKNTNPMDGLTAEQMSGYLERVLYQHDDWMVYSTALLERAWLECERAHARERAILQIQALADQHTNRLTLTQSTFQSVEEDSAPAQDRIRNLHSIVYPPRWEIMRDLAERYAKIGVVTTAAEIFEELELWDEVVECYRLAGRESKAEQIVRERLAAAETPRMWAALGDLTNDPSCYEKSLELSKGRFSSAYVALGKYFFDNGDLRAASDNFKKALKIKPLSPAVWFRVGTISMTLGEWETALHAFSEVVQQMPEEGDAWANVAAIHMYNEKPVKAYPALVEALKHNRTNWRIWVSKLYVCIDLKKYDEAIQACHQLIDLKSKKNEKEAVPPLEEKCVRAIVGGVLINYESASAQKDQAALDSSRRTLSRVRDLLDKISSTMKSEAWIHETYAFFNERTGRSEEVLNELMKEYRTLQGVQGWETDGPTRAKVFRVVLQIHEIYSKEGSRDSLVKCKFLLKSISKKIRAAHFDDSNFPAELTQIEKLLFSVEESLAMNFKNKTKS